MENQEEKRVEFEDVNKFVEGWYPSTLFSSFDIRVFPTFQNDIISRMEQISVIRRKLTKKLGEEDIDWFIVEDHRGFVELYMKDSGVLILWKLNDHEEFTELFDRVEQHREEINEKRNREEI